MASSEVPQGIVLCERPGPALESMSRPTPFLPTSSTKNLEPLGLCPTGEVRGAHTISKPNKTFNAAKEVRMLEASNKEAAEAQQKAVADQAERAAVLANFTAGLRARILEGKDVSHWQPVEKARKVKGTLMLPLAINSTNQMVPISARTDAHHRDQPCVLPTHSYGVEEFMEDLMKEASGLNEQQRLQQQPPTAESRPLGQAAEAAAVAVLEQHDERAPSSSASAKHRSSSRGQPSGKPAWAMTPSQAQQLEAAEEDELLSFAENLDYDTFLSQLDDENLQETLLALQEQDAGAHKQHNTDAAWQRTFVRVLNHVAMKQAQADASQSRPGSVCGPAEHGLARSMASGGMRAGLRGGSQCSASEGPQAREWCGSSRAGDDDVARQERSAVAREASDFLRENPELRGVHSLASVLALLQKPQLLAQ